MRNRYTAVKAQPLYGGLSPDEASFTYGIGSRRGDPPPLGGGPRQANLASSGERTPSRYGPVAGRI